MRVRHQVIFSVSDDAAGEEGEFSRTGNLPAISSDSFDANACGTFYAGADQFVVYLGFGNVAQGRGLYLEASGPAQVEINGSENGPGVQLGLQSIEPNAKGKLFFEGEVFRVSVQSATPGVAIHGSYCIWGHTPAVTP